MMRITQKQNSNKQQKNQSSFGKIILPGVGSYRIDKGIKQHIFPATTTRKYMLYKAYEELHDLTLVSIVFESKLQNVSELHQFM